MTPEEKRVFSETYTKVYLQLQLERAMKHGAVSFTDPFYRTSRQHGQEQDSGVAADIAGSAVSTLREALTDREPGTSQPSRPAGGFEHL